MGDAVEAPRIKTYAELRKAISARRRALGLSQEAMNDKAGLTGGYINKLEVGIRHFGDMSLDAVLGALGVDLVLMPAVKITSKHRLGKPGIVAVPLICAPVAEKKEHLTCQQKGGRARAEKLSAVRRSEISRKAARSRWKRQRKLVRDAIAKHEATAKAPAI